MKFKIYEVINKTNVYADTAKYMTNCYWKTWSTSEQQLMPQACALIRLHYTTYLFCLLIWSLCIAVY